MSFYRRCCPPCAAPAPADPFLERLHEHMSRALVASFAGEPLPPGNWLRSAIEETGPGLASRRDLKPGPQRRR